MRPLKKHSKKSKKLMKKISQRRHGRIKMVSVVELIILPMVFKFFGGRVG